VVRNRIGTEVEVLVGVGSRREDEGESNWWFVWLRARRLPGVTRMARILPTSEMAHPDAVVRRITGGCSDLRQTERRW
jgi:hypothetical protein